MAKEIFLTFFVSLTLAASTNVTNEDRTKRQIPEAWLYDFYRLGAPAVLPIPKFHEPFLHLDNNLEGRSLYHSPHPFVRGSSWNAEHEQIQSRANGLGASALNSFLNNRFSASNRFRPFANLLPVQLNPNFPNLLATIDSCTAPTGEYGICAPGAICSAYGGRPSGSCGVGAVCCINAVTSCSGTVTLNNTYWQSPTSAISTPSSCALTVKLSPRLIEQKKPICQVRLDFVAFTTAQPSATTGPSRGVCNVDTFQVSGASTRAPVICGDNAGQHMYFTVPNSGTTATDLQMVFNFGSGSTITRSWNIKVALLPCGADVLAPNDCLQYFTSTTGKVMSFNFKDTAPASRKLANQDYNICFRTELVNGQKANQLCIEECTVTTGNNPFRISGGTDLSQTVDATGFCQNDYLVFVGAMNSDNLALDRFCGGSLNTASLDGKTSVCSKATPFRIYFHTDATEAVTENINDPITNTVIVILGDELNVGFCLNYQQKVV